jgi:hypothetical protein
MTADEEVESVNSTESENSDVTENEYEGTESEDEASESENVQSSFFDHLLKEILHGENYTKKKLITLMADNTQLFLELKKLAKNDSMLKKIERKVDKYTRHGLNYNEAISTVLENEAAYFNKLLARIKKYDK